MREVCVAGVGQTSVFKHAEASAVDLGAEAVRQAVDRAGLGRPSALYVGNMLSGLLSSQLHLGALVAERSGLAGVEAASAEAACASGAAATRWGHMAIASGMHDVVVVCGTERMAHATRTEVTQALATASDWRTEGACGETFISLNARLMRLYLDRYRLREDALAPFAVNAHSNSVNNPNALFHKPISVDDYLSSRVVADPVRLFDVSPVCDGAAALVLCSGELLKAVRPGAPRVRIRASAVSTDSVGLSGRRDPLDLAAAGRSSAWAFEQAGLTPADIDLFELHDAYTVMSALSLEAAGFARPGRGHALAAEGEIRVDGRIPVTTMGGLKGRGHPVGATGIYQLVEAYLQLIERAGANQVRDARLAMAQSFGGTAATVVTHILERQA